MSVREGLDYDHHSRTSRWPPGTRMSYCNSGPPVAAYIVERLTGQKLEDFVQQNLFLPIGMRTATYFEPAPGTATTLYHDDGKTPYPYGHILMRPAGSINASANDMAAYLARWAESRLFPPPGPPPPESGGWTLTQFWNIDSHH